MSVAGTAAITEMWAKCKAWFGRKLGASTTATTVSIQLKNNAGDNLGDAATIAAATTTAAGAMSADDKTKLNGIATGATANAATTTTPKMDGTAAVGSETAYAKGDHVHPTDTSRQATLVSGTNIKTIGSQSILGSGNLTPANIGAAATSHSHGNITSGGDITATAPTVASGDCLVINDDSASKITNGPAFGTSTTTYLRNDGTWGTPVGQANQNAFSNVKVGSTTIAADTTTDTIEIVAGSNVTLTPDATNDKLTITATDTTYTTFGENVDGLVPSSAAPSGTYSGANLYLTPDADWAPLDADSVLLGETMADSSSGSWGSDQDLAGYLLQMEADIAAKPSTDNDTKNTAGSTNSTSKLFLVGATSQAANPQTYSSSKVYETDGDLHATTYNGVEIRTLTGGGFELLGTVGNIAALKVHGGADYDLGDACEKGVDTSITSGSTSTNLPTSQAVAAYIATQMTGAATFQGTLVASGTPSSNTWDESDIEAASYKKGWYWVCQTAGTYTGKTLEVGDMLFCVEGKGSSYAAADFTAVQNNLVEMTTAEVDAICV